MKIPSIAEIKAALKGKVYHVFDSWNGSSSDRMILNIRHSKEHKGHYDLILKANEGRKVEETVSPFAIHQLVQYGRHETVHEIDYCVCHRRYTII